MKETQRIGVALIVALVLLVTGCNTLGAEKEPPFIPDTQLADLNELGKGKSVIVRSEEYQRWPVKTLESLPECMDYDIDLRFSDLSMLDLSDEADALRYATFDSQTVWPEALPDGYDPSVIMETGKNPGLGIRALHEQGITGEGVSIAIIDQGLLVEHEEYAANLMLYERLHCSDSAAQMHGPAVASIAVGKSVGVAPGAKLYYIASTFGKYYDTGFEFDAGIIADGILRVLAVNEHLSDEEKIRVISISKGIGESDLNADRYLEAVARADEANVFVITTSVIRSHGIELNGLGRAPGRDPDDYGSYEPGLFWSDMLNSASGLMQPMLMVPMDSRTTAGPMGIDDYAFYAQGGLSWSVPWLAGLYALCAQVRPDITVETFADAARKTGVTTQIAKNGKAYDFGKIINPQALIDELTGKNQ